MIGERHDTLKHGIRMPLVKNKQKKGKQRRETEKEFFCGETNQGMLEGLKEILQVHRSVAASLQCAPQWLSSVIQVRVQFPPIPTYSRNDNV